MHMGDKENNSETMIEQLVLAFRQLDARKEAPDDKIQWVEIKQYFDDLEATLKKKVEELEAKDRDYAEKQSENDRLLAERGAAVASKEQDLVDRLEELKVAVVDSAVDDACVKYNEDNKVSRSLGNTNSPLEGFCHKSGENSEGMDTEDRSHHDLKPFCEQMDAKGLMNYVMENKRNLPVTLDEILVVLESATDPARLVLDSLEGFYPSNETTQLKDKMDPALQGMRKYCILIMEAMATLVARAGPVADQLLNLETKQHAKAIAGEWRRNLARADIDAANGNSLEAEAFLQLLSTFRIASEFNEEELCKLVLAVAEHRQAPELCRSIGLVHKVPAIVELLINKGKQISAVHFIHAFQLQQSFAPVPLLKVYIKNQKQISQVMTGNLSDIAGVKNDANEQELAALKIVIKCIEEYKLKSDYPLDTLQKRVTQLEKLKPGKKRSGEFNKLLQSKRPRANKQYSLLHSSSRRSIH